jgi:hypothetical protein
MSLNYRANSLNLAFALSSMAFSGVFRHSKNGFNASAKGGRQNDGKHDEKRLRPAYELSLARWKDLAPAVRNCSYADVSLDDIRAIGDRPLVILDPPYEGSKAAYNDAPRSKSKPEDFDFAAYWNRASEINEQFDVLLFDRASNLEAKDHKVEATRKMTVRGGRKSDVEGMSFLKRRVAEQLFIAIVMAILRAIIG